MKNSLLCFLLFLGGLCAAQDKQTYPVSFNPDTLMQEPKTNPVLYADISLGGAFGNSSGFFANTSFNYRYKHNLFTARYSGLLEREYIGTFLYAFPLYRTREEVEEFALLYGYGNAAGGTSWSFSGGASVLSRKMYYYTDTSKIMNQRVGFSFPFEFSIKWFKEKKAPYHIYYIIPVGPPTGLGHSFGFKIVGNVGVTTFVGICLTFGWGWHKHY